MEILFKGIAKKTGQPVIGYHLKMLNEHGEMVDKIYKNCGLDNEQWGFIEIESGTLEFFLDGKEANKPFKFDFAGVKSFECRCGQKFINITGEGWIPVDERMPEDDVDVLITYADIDDENYTDICITTYGYAYLGGNKLDYKEWRNPFEYFNVNYKVIAWKPLPKPYRTEGE